MRQQKPQSRAFTLIELLVSIGVIALLLAITIPSIFAARASARRVKSSANLRTLVGVIGEYASANTEFFPRVVEGRWYQSVESTPFRYPFWHVYNTWVAVVVDFMPRAGYRELVLCPGAPGLTSTTGYSTSYWYSWSFVCPPGYWNRSSPEPAARKVGVKTFQVAFPSRKALLWDNQASYEGSRRLHHGYDFVTPVPVAFVDQSVRVLKPVEATEPVLNPEFWPSARVKLLATENGVAGVDF